MTDNQAMEITDGLAEQLSALAERITPELVNGACSAKAFETLLRAGFLGQRPRARNEPNYEADAKFFTLVANNLPAIIAALSRPATPAAGDAEVAIDRYSDQIERVKAAIRNVDPYCDGEETLAMNCTSQGLEDIAKAAIKALTGPGE